MTDLLPEMRANAEPSRKSFRVPLTFFSLKRPGKDNKPIVHNHVQNVRRRTKARLSFSDGPHAPVQITTKQTQFFGEKSFNMFSSAHKNFTPISGVKILHETWKRWTLAHLFLILRERWWVSQGFSRRSHWLRLFFPWRAFSWCNFLKKFLKKFPKGVIFVFTTTCNNMRLLVLISLHENALENFENALNALILSLFLLFQQLFCQITPAYMFQSFC